MNQRQRLLEQIRQQSIQKRTQALREAAQKQASNTPIVAAAAAGAAAGGGGGQRGCTERDGLTFLASVPNEGPRDEFQLFTRAFIPYIGTDEAGNSVFRAVLENRSSDDDISDIAIKVAKSGDQWLFIAEITDPRLGTVETPVAVSDEVYGSWSNIPNPFEIEYSSLVSECGDQTYKKLCITTVTRSPFGNIIETSGSLEAIVPLISEEYPIAYGGFGSFAIFWEPELSAWFTEDGTELPGDLSQPPIGQFDTSEGTIIITEGSCSGEVPTPPGPTLITTSDIQTSIKTTWSWFGLPEFQPGPFQNGSIDGLLVDGQSASISGGLATSNGVYQMASPFQIQAGPTAGVYVITLAPGATASLSIGSELGGGFQFIGNFYEVISMVLNITTDGTSPIDSDFGRILQISGTITYTEAQRPERPIIGSGGDEPVTKP
jgi:hypothetical protein